MEAAQILEEADIIFSDNAAKKVSDLIQEEKNNDLKFYLH
jgi:iron-sulfur cluster insertion protein